MLHPNAAPTKELTGIEVTTEPTKVAYTEGETFDPTGMVVTGTYSDSTTEEITDYTPYLYLKENYTKEEIKDEAPKPKKEIIYKF